MTLPLLPLIDGCLFVDNSGWMEKFSTCPRALQYSQLSKRISSSESVALNFGTAIHQALDLRYKVYGSDLIDPLYMDSMSTVLSHFFNEHPTPMGDHRDLNWAIETIKRYNARYEKEEFTLLEYDEPIDCGHCMPLSSNTSVFDCPFCFGTGKQSFMVELPFALHLYDYSFSDDAFSTILARYRDIPRVIPTFYTGRIDLPLYRGDQIFVLDHKSTSMLGKGFFAEKKMSAQAKGYCWAFEQLTGKPVRGYGINALRTSMPTQAMLNGKPNRKGEIIPLEKFWDESFQREWFYLNPGELDEWKHNTIALIDEFFWNYARGYMPMKTSWCVGKYGQCPYLEVCSLYPKEERDFLLQSGNFTDNVWSPLISPTQGKVMQ